MAPEQISLPFGARRGARLRLCPGPRAAERALFEDLDRLFDEVPLEAAIARPVLLVVPSISLRGHLLARYAAHRGGAVVGLACRTLFHLAIDLTERSGPRRPLHPRLDAVLARRLAAAEPALARPLGDLRDGYSAVAASVADLLDAGLDPSLVAGLDDALAAEGPAVAARREVERARALVRVAAATAERLEALDVERPSGLLARATALLRTEAAEEIAPRALRVYGFGDATGAATDLLAAVVDRWAGVVYFDRPPDPADRSRTDPGARFTRRFFDRMATVAAEGEAASATAAPRIDLFRAPGGEAEVREVARRLRRLLDRGEPAERMGVVARRIEPYRTALRHQLEALGVPFSGSTPGPLSPTGRRLTGLLEMIETGGRTPVDRWLDLLPTAERPTSGEDLRLALFQLGAGRLEDAAGIDLAPHLDRNGRYRLPARLGFVAARDEEDADDGPRAIRTARRSVDGEALGDTIARARRATARLASLAAAQTVGTTVEELVRLGLEELGWEPEEGAGQALIEVLEATAEGLPADLPLTASELARLIEPELERKGAVPLGGAGSGVPTLDLIEARGRTFEHLFVLGLNRGEFPRTVREDPALPDALRRVLGRTGFGPLPDLPRKLDGFDEERYLFAQLVASAPRVTLSWQEFDDEGARRTVSPLVERLRWSTAADPPADAAAPPLVPTVFAAASAGGGGDAPPRPAREEAIVAGLYGDRDQLGAALALALEEAGSETDSARRLAAVRRRVIDEVDPIFGTPEGERTRRRLGPWLGAVGPLAGDGPEAPVYVTRLERLAVCPWQTFLTKVLRLEPLPDPLDLLPTIDPLLVGNVLHGALERIVWSALDGRQGPLEEILTAEPVPLERPSAAELTGHSRRAAERALAERGVALPGFARALARVVDPYLELAFDLDWDDPEETPRVLGAEIQGEVAVDDDRGRQRTVRFRADRVDQTASGPLLTDYKTGGKELCDRDDKAKKLLREKVARGEWLQAIAYALGAGIQGARGRYLLVKPDPDTPPGARRLAAAADDAELISAFERSARTALAVWDRGLLFRRLVRADRDQRPPACRWCEVAAACVEGDSGARIRLRDWAERRTNEGPGDDGERALLELWWQPYGGFESRRGDR